MNRRSFSKTVLSLGAAAQPGMAQDSYEEPAKKLPSRRFDVVVAGGGTAGVVAAIAAARQGAKTILIEAKGITKASWVSHLKPTVGLGQGKEIWWRTEENDGLFQSCAQD